MEPARRRAARAQLIRALAVSGLLVVVYFLAPVEPAATGVRAVVRGALAAAGLVVVAVQVARLVVRLLRDESGAGAASLLVALVGGVVMFAFVDYLVAVSQPDQFADLETKTDGLYFAVTTLTTTGFGDVHARGELARALVTVQMVYNIAVIATGASALVNRITARRREPPGPRR